MCVKTTYRTAQLWPNHSYLLSAEWFDNTTVSQHAFLRVQAHTHTLARTHTHTHTHTHKHALSRTEHTQVMTSTLRVPFLSWKVTIPTVSPR